MGIKFFEEDKKVPFLKRRIFKKALEKVVEELKMQTGDINYIFCSDEYLYRMNMQYLNHDTYTDIITFDYTEDNVLSGDIFISVDRVSENAKNFGVDKMEELKRVLSHGLLHLAGYKDKTKKDALQMREMENKMMEVINRELSCN